ncbi:MAG TPA: quinoprotein dehydrogenase-associated SoxYZ-like carrier [Burkholderiaceae bacterium]|jgi:sulfur-oxidizing protein SoxY|nr:quinoprotein dehydrogenase-associated SoxYZ-like carrier [Burkholderiaceae bacterium]
MSLPASASPTLRSRRRVLASALATGLAPVLARAASEVADNENNERWQMLRKSLFQNRTISEDSAAIIELDTPARAADAAVVPIAFRTRFVQTAGTYIKKVHLVIDRNPSPMGATFTFTPESGRAEIETRVRIEEYTHVRAIAEMNDGRLFMHTRFVKASGGCSAPAGKDLQAALANAGRMKLRVEGDVVLGQPTLAQLSISHPNVSGLAIDQVSRLAPPPHYVRSIEVAYAGKPVLSADLDFTISENPNVRFFFVPKEAGQLTVNVIDSNDAKFEKSLAVAPGQRSDA